MANDDTLFNIDDPDFDEPQPAPSHLNTQGGYRVPPKPSDPPAKGVDQPAPGESLNDFYARIRGEKKPETAPKSQPQEPKRPQQPQKPREQQRPHEDKPQAPRGRSWWVIILVVVVLAIIGAIWLNMANQNREDLKAEDLQAKIEQLELDNQQLALQNDYDNLNKEFESYEIQTKAITNDAVKSEIQKKYNDAKARVEALLKELKDTKNKSAEQIAQLKAEIGTLRDILKHYVEEIDRLSKENEALREENTAIKEENASLTSRVTETVEQNTNLTQRMVLAEKLNLTGVAVNAYNKKGKVEKKLDKVSQFAVSFTISPNASTPPGQKTIYMRLTSPTGQLLGQSGSFRFEGQDLPFTSRKTVDYGGQEVSGEKIYYNVNTALTPGSYTVELFTDGYRLASRHFTVE